MRACPQPIVAAVDGVCAGAGAMIALASDFRLGVPTTRTAFLFVRVGLAGCDMGACTLLPRMIGQGARIRAPVHRPGDDGGRGPCVGVLSAA
jgi:enoyl-CoA hydratase/carnithine racemase